MNDKSFLDTNILIYCYTATEPDKRQNALRVASLSNAFISTQVLQEFVNTLRKKFRVEWSDITSALEEVESNFAVHVNEHSTVKGACRIAQRYRFSFYDSLIIAAALECDCKTLYSEDMQHEQKIDDRLTIINPFHT